MTKPIRGKTIMGQPILEVQLSITMTPYEAELLNDIFTNFTTNKLIAIIDKLSKGDTVIKEQELLEEYKNLIDKISKHTTAIQE